MPFPQSIADSYLSNASALWQTLQQCIAALADQRAVLADATRNGTQEEIDAAQAIVDANLAEIAFQAENLKLATAQVAVDISADSGYSPASEADRLSDVVNVVVRGMLAQFDVV